MVNISNILYYWILKDSCAGIASMISIPGAFNPSHVVRLKTDQTLQIHPWKKKLKKMVLRLTLLSTNCRSTQLALRVGTVGWRQLTHTLAGLNT
jgi:hypothetical protein